MKKFTLLFLLFLFITCMTGCYKEYEKEDIVKYLKNEKNLDNFKVIKEPEIIVDENGYEDVYWTVKLKDLEGVTFYVIENKGYYELGPSSYITDTYAESMFKYMVNEYDDFTRFTFEEAGFGSESCLVVYYKDYEDLEGCYKELGAFKKYVEEQGFKEEYAMGYEFRMENPLRYNIAESGLHVMDDGDYSGFVTSFGESAIKEIEERYLQVCLDYRFENLLDQVTEEKLRDLISRSKYTVGICRSGSEDGPYEYYEDLGSSIYGYGVSYGTLFRILQKEGFDVSGDVDHYTFYGVNDDIYEVSYDFHEKNPELAVGEESYYYLKNGEQIWMAANFYNHFTSTEIKEMTGLQLKCGR